MCVRVHVENNGMHNIMQNNNLRNYTITCHQNQLHALYSVSGSFFLMFFACYSQVDSLSSKLESRMIQLSSTEKEQQICLRQVRELDAALTKSKVCVCIINEFACVL